MGAVSLNQIGNAYEHAGELLNFGAFLAFMGVNLSAFWHFALLRSGRVLADIVLPLIGFGFCASIWLTLNHVAQIVGGIWFVIGFSYLAMTTSFFQRAPKTIDFTEA